MKSCIFQINIISKQIERKQERKRKKKEKKEERGRKSMEPRQGEQSKQLFSY